MKKIMTSILLISILLSLAGCSGKDKAGEVANDNDRTLIQEQISKDDESIDMDGASDNDDDIKTTAVASSDKVETLTELEEFSKNLSLELTKGKVNEIYDILTPTVKKQFTEKDLKEAWNMIVADMGNFIELGEISEVIEGNNKTVYVILKYENIHIEVSYYYNESKKLEGIFFDYVTSEEEFVSNDYFEESEITFGKKENPIEGILTMPKDVKKPPVAILVHGSGHHDADETIGPNKPFRDIAHGLARQGIAVIRYKESSIEKVMDKLTIQDDSLNDASQAIKYAQSCGKFNTDKIYLIGHSLGGMMAPKLAADNKEVDGIVSLGGSPRKLEDIVYDQNNILLKEDKSVTEDIFKAHMAEVKMAVDKIKNLKEASSEEILGYPASYWYSLNQIDIAGIAKSLDIPILIAQGSADFQVYADIDYKAWQELLEGKDNVTFRLYDNLNHLFMTSNGMKDMTEQTTG